MQVQSPEKIREDAKLTAYRMAKMLGISQKNYNDIITGAIKTPNGKIIINLILIAINYAGWSERKALQEVCKDFGIDEPTLEQRYNKNKKIEYKKKVKSS